MVPVKKAGPRYAIKAVVSVLLIGVFQYLSRRLAPGIANPALHTAIAFLPMIPIALFGFAGLRLYRALDEMRRRQILVGISGGVWLFLLVNMAYRYVPDAGLPDLPPGVPVLIVCICVFAVLAALRDSLSEMQTHE